MSKNIMVYFNSRKKDCKTHFGAIDNRTKQKFSIFCHRRLAPLEVSLCIFTDETEDKKIYEMTWKNTDKGWDEYTCQLPFLNCGLYFYYFILKTDISVIYLGAPAEGHGGEGRVSYCVPIPYEMTVYSSESVTPDWFSKGVTYQIFPDRFAFDRPPAPMPGREIVSDIYRIPRKTVLPNGDIPNNYYYGGNLRGIINNLENLAALGVTVLYLNPIFASPSNHRYDTADYLKIDPYLGSEKDFSELCTRAKDYNIRVILDGVFNHTGADSIYFNLYGHYPGKGAYQGEESPYYDWYSFKDFPEEYDCWWGVKILPNVNEKAPSFRRFIAGGENSVVRKWLRLGASGWRLDVADELPDDFIEEIRSSARKEKSDALILGEVWEDASNKIAYETRRRYFLGNELDGVMNYPLRDAILHTLLFSDTAYFMETSLTISENYPTTQEKSLMNLLSSHDTPRILTLLSGAEEPENSELAAAFRLSPEQRKTGLEKLRLAYLLLFTHLGSPTIYYGDETAMEGFGDPMNRAFYRVEDGGEELRKFVHSLAMIRKQNSCLSEIRPDFLEAEKGRLMMSWGGRMLLILNAGDKEENFTVPGEWEPILLEKISASSLSETILFPSRSAALLKRKYKG